MLFSRYGVYYVPEPGELAEFGARWLGWDVQNGINVAMFDVAGLDHITATPRKYGFHATLKPPFRLANGYREADLLAHVKMLADTTIPARGGPLTLTQLGRFFALTLSDNTDEISALAARLVTELDHFRAPLTPNEIARRRPETLSPRKREHLERWGYPHVLDCFRFHMTLTARLSKEHIDHAKRQLDTLLPDLPRHLNIQQIAVVGERPDGYFQLISRYPLSGNSRD